jgi:hypothetical protein
VNRNGLPAREEPSSSSDGVVHVIAESFWKPEFVQGVQGAAASSHDFR